MAYEDKKKEYEESTKNKNKHNAGNLADKIRKRKEMNKAALKELSSAKPRRKRPYGSSGKRTFKA